MNNYQRIAEVIRYLNDCYTEQPSLTVLAQRAGLSQFHFHRLFSDWAGITPKEFVQYLTVSHAKQLLRRGESVLDAALTAGLSGPGRLHDLCVSLEAASPGELKFGGEGWTIDFGFSQTPFGLCLVGSGPRGICQMSFVESEDEKAAMHAFQQSWPKARLNRDDALASKIAAKIFARTHGGKSHPTLRAFVRGTAFQVRVWRALLQIPAGSLLTYGRLAETIGSPTAARAVGAAVAQNPVAYLIPCHRVIRETGAFGGYRWDPVRKQAIVAWECSKPATQRNPIAIPVA